MPEPSVWLPAAHSSSARRHALIYFICGNPGLIEFYRDFLTYLRGLLDGGDHSGSTTAYDIFGKNLPGFRDVDHEPFSPTNPPLHLDVVIEKTYDDVISRRRDGGEEYDEVVLLGHSLGTFISVEIFQRHSVQGKSRAAKLSLSHGLLLFPTVTHLALSPSGKRFTFVMSTIPLLERYGHIWARLLLRLVPAMVLTFYMTRVLGFTPRAAGTTAGWLKSRDGVWQTLSLARDELVMIAGEDRWGEEIWEAPQQQEEDGEQQQQQQRRRFFMFYAKKDHWIADHVRDEFVERMRRGEEGEGRKGRVPRTEIDEGGIRHDFCTKDDSSLEVAQRVSGWIGEIDQARRS